MTPALWACIIPMAPLFNAFIMVSMPTASYTRLVPPINTIKTNTTGFNRYFLLRFTVAFTMGVYMQRRWYL